MTHHKFASDSNPIDDDEKTISEKSFSSNSLIKNEGDLKIKLKNPNDGHKSSIISTIRKRRESSKLKIESVPEKEVIPEVRVLSLEEFWEEAAKSFNQEKENFQNSKTIIEKCHPVLSYENYIQILQEKDKFNIDES